MRRVDSVAPDLPFTTVADDVATVQRAIDEASGEVVLVGHSRGGQVITMAASGSAKVRRLVYVAAQMLPEGATRAPNHRRTPGALSLAEIEGPPSVEAARDTYYHDCPDELVREAVAHLRVVPASAKGAASTVPAAWRAIPSAYVVCTDDHMIHPDDQRDMAGQATEIFELSSSHSPFFSHPVELAVIIGRYVQR